MTLALLCLIVLGLVLFRCAGFPARDKAGRTTIPANCAILTVENLGNRDWSVSLYQADWDEQVERRIDSGKTVEVVLRAGKYRVDQKLFASEQGPSQSRRFDISFLPGKKYRWRLMNLLSSDQTELSVAVGGRGTP